MSASREQDLDHFVGAWRNAAGFLERERAERLRRLSDAQCREAIASIFATALPPAPERGSGLVEQQRLFRKLA